MFADKDIIAHLNAALKHKLTGINQYFLHARMLKHQGNVKLADQEYKASLEAMKHADMLVEHILSHGGIPNLQDLGKLMIGETSDAMLANDLKMTEAALTQVTAALALCEDSKDRQTISLLTKIADGQREHITTIRNQLAIIKRKECA